jgi:sugar lactone lactonase YvrE
MRRVAFVLVLSTALAPASCNRSSSSQTRGIAGVTTVCGVAADPSRDRVYVGDTTTGRVVALDVASGLQVSEVSLGDTIGGMALDGCYSRLYVSVTGGLRIDVVDPDSFLRASTLNLGVPVYALAPGASGHLLAVTSSALVDLDPATMKRTPLLPNVDVQSFLCSDRFASRAWLAESRDGEVVVSTFDLTDLAAPATTSQPGLVPGSCVGIALAADGSKLYVGTDGADGVVVLDAVSLTKLGTIPLGPGLHGIAANTTATRLYFTYGDLLVESVNLDLYAAGRETTLTSAMRERGLAVAPNNASLVVSGDDTVVTQYPLFDLTIDVASAVRQGVDYTLTIEGDPNAPWFLFWSQSPGYAYLDAPTSDDPRFFDLDGSTFGTIATGTLDSTGHGQLSDTIPSGLVGPIDFVIQLAELRHPGKSGVVISNPVAIRILAADCSPSP